MAGEHRVALLRDIFSEAGPYGGPLPTSYLTLALETTGFNRENDYIVRAAFADVVNGEATLSTVLLAWPNFPGVDNEWLRERLVSVRESVEAKGTHRYPLDYDALMLGQSPLVALQSVGASLALAAVENRPVFAHSVDFVRSMWEAHMPLLPTPISGLTDVQWWDTAMLAKALEYTDVDPIMLRNVTYGTTTPEQWQEAVKTIRGRVKYSQEWCEDTYDLWDGAPANVLAWRGERTAMRNAWLTYQLVESWRELLDRADEIVG